MVVTVLGNYQLRTGLRGGIDCLYCRVVKRTILTAEGCGQHAIVRAARQIGIGVLRIRTRLGGVTETATYGCI